MVETLIEFIFGLLATGIVCWFLLLPFIGAFHLFSWVARWMNHEGMPEEYIDNLKMYITAVLIYALGASILLVMSYIPVTDWVYSSPLWLIYFFAIPTLFPMYYWVNIFGLARRIKKSLITE